MTTLEDKLKEHIQTDILNKGRNSKNFVGRPFVLDYQKAHILVSDAWKYEVGGLPMGSFLLAFYMGEENVSEALLLRTLGPAKLPTDNYIVSSMIEYYKDNLNTSGREGSKMVSKLDEFTRYEFSFSGLECRILGAFYKTGVKKDDENTDISEFGADVENFYSANNYEVYKATGNVLKAIVNQRDGGNFAGGNTEFKIGKVRYSSSRRFQANNDKDVDVYISPNDFLGKRTALFGMTRTGKSNTVKKIIQATVEISNKSKNKLDDNQGEMSEPIQKGSPAFPVGQIIFDINGEYANPNLQDEGTAIYALYSKNVIRYSVLPKHDFKVMKVNFYSDPVEGFDLINSYFNEKKESSDYVKNFLSINLEKPTDYNDDHSVKTRYDRLLAAYYCCLYSAGFLAPNGFKTRFQGNKEINDDIDPSKEVSLQKATEWFQKVWTNYKSDFFNNYKSKKKKEWADEDLKAVLVFLTRNKNPGSSSIVSGYLKLKAPDLQDLHTNTMDTSFKIEIPKYLEEGKIVIIDLSQGSKTVQNLFSEKICEKIFSNSMSRFIENKNNNFIQFYFEEAHNLFPKKEDKDLSQIYNRIAKEGAKLHIGMIYATQEVSSISSNILKNTQNWFIAHLNNDDELKELRKYYDFEDFVGSLIRFSANNDKGFVRMKTYTNPFVVPVQVDRFLADQR